MPFLVTWWAGNNRQHLICDTAHDAYNSRERLLKRSNSMERESLVPICIWPMELAETSENVLLKIRNMQSGVAIHN